MKPQIKNICLLTFISFILVLHASVFAQTMKLEESRLVSVEKAIDLITLKYKVNFSFSSDLVNLSKKININLHNKTINEVLEQFAEQANVDYRLQNNQVILFPKRKSLKSSGSTFYIHGYVRDLYTKELLPDILIYCSINNSSTYSNKYGYYSIEIPSSTDSVELQAHLLGYKLNKRKLPVQNNSLVNWELETSIQLKDIEINDNRVEEKTFHKSLISDNVDDQVRENSPRLLGEKDALASARYYAGVNRETDISNGYNIRGGRADQNLIILDDAPIYHTFHLFGLYSVFNEDALKQMNLLKGGFPARYGGRLSSVVELITKDGDLQNYHSEVGTGLIASHIGLEGPIIKDKLGFFVTGRSSHITEVMKMVGADDDFSYRFYDINTKLQWKITDKNRLFFSFYSGADKLNNINSSSNETNNYIAWGNQTATLRWNHLFHPKWFANTSIIYTNYKLNTEQKDSTIHMRYSSGIEDINFKHEIDYFHSDKHHLKAGVSLIFHQYTPSESIQIDGLYNDNAQDKFLNEEFAFYVEDEIKFSNKFSANIGVRESGFKYRDFIRFNAEPRIMSTFLLNNKMAFKASYGRMFQYSHYLNTFISIGLPTDLWMPSTEELRPEQSDQFSLGFYFNNKKLWRFNIEAFYKYQQDILSYAPNSTGLAKFLSASSNEFTSWADRTMEGFAKIYGVEMQAEYNHPICRSIVAYTLSFNKNKFEELGYTDWFWSSNDRRHNLSLLNFIHFSKRWGMNINWVFTTGTPFSLPEASYTIADHEPGNFNESGGWGSTQFYAFDYKGVNNYRMSSYHRLDISFTYKYQRKKSIFEFQLGAMNAYNRKNSMFYTISYNDQTSKNELKRTAFLGITPTFSVNYKF